MKKFMLLLFVSCLATSFINAQETKDTEPKKWKFGLHFDDLTAKNKFTSGAPVDLEKGVVIHKVSKDHPAEAAGMMVGDVLTHVSGIEIIDQKHCIEVMKNVDVSKGTSLLKIIRNGVRMDVLVHFK